MKLNITQYLRPNGTPKAIELEIPDRYADKVAEIERLGCIFTCEQLQTREAVSYISHPLGDFDLRITAPLDYNAAKLAVHDLIEKFDAVEFVGWVAEHQQGDADND